MLLRFLGLATLSVTVLTVKAMGSTEAEKPYVASPAEIAYEIVYATPVVNQTASYADSDAYYSNLHYKSYDDPVYTGTVNTAYMPANYDSGISSHLAKPKKQVAGYKRTPPLPVRLRSNADDVKGGIANLLGRKTGEKKHFIRHAYLPPSHNFEATGSEIASDAAPTNILASLESETQVIREKGRIAEEVEALIDPTSVDQEEKAKAARDAIKKRFKKSKRAARPKSIKRKAAKQKTTKRKTASQKKRYRQKKYAAAKKYRRKSARKYRTDYLAAFN